MLPEIIEKRFEEYKKDIPEFIEYNDEYYGHYKMRSVIFLSFDYYYDGMSREEFRKIQKMMMNANSEFRKILIYFNIKTIKETSKGETFAIYTADTKDNKDWLENNKDCGYLKSVPSYKGNMPLSINVDRVLNEYWEKYPFTKIK